MAKITLDCKYCGAPLVIQSGETLVKCEYCGMTTVVEAPEGVGPLVEYAFMILENGRFKDASREFENVLRRAPKNSDAHLGKLMAEFQIKTKDEMKTCVRRFCDSENYKNLMKYGSPEWVNIVRSNNIAALGQERDGCIRELDYMKHNNMSYENNLKNRVNDANNALSSYKISILISAVCTAAAWVVMFGSMILGNTDSSSSFSAVCLLLAGAFSGTTVYLVFGKDKDNKTETNRGKKEQEVKIAQEKLNYACNINRNKENELQNRINTLQAIIDDEEKKLQ